MENRKVYEKPEMNVITFEVEDIIRTSDETPIVPGEGLADNCDELNWRI